MRNTGVRRLALMCAMLLATGCAFAQTSVLTPLGPLEIIWGQPLDVRADVSQPCSSLALPVMPPPPTIRLTASGTLLETVTPTIVSGCSGFSGSLTGQATFGSPADLGFGSYVLLANFTWYASVNSAPLVVRINPEFTTVVPRNLGIVKTGLSGRGAASTCTERHAILQDRMNLSVPLPPPNMRYPYEHIAYAASGCSYNPAASGLHSQKVMIEVTDPIPLDTEVWVHSLRTIPAWQRVPATINGRQLTFFLTGGVGTDNSIVATAALAIPQPDSRNGPQQDLWWSGTEESGWGLNIAKIEQRIFATLFIYDGEGKPLWVVMPSGTWDPVHMVYYGDLFIPSGTTSYANYDPYYFHMNAPVGVGSLSFTSDDDGNLDYVINGEAGGKQIGRYKFARVAADGAAPYAGMWWGGPTQDGWGLSVQQQGQTLFTTWYTYGADGKVTWFYMPGGSWTSATKYSGPLYRTTGSRWAGVNYDASKLKVIPVGTMSLDFGSPNAATMSATVDGVTITRPISRFLF
jgi:hypothetical protein